MPDFSLITPHLFFCKNRAKNRVQKRRILEVLLARVLKNSYLCNVIQRSHQKHEFRGYSWCLLRIALNGREDYPQWYRGLFRRKTPDELTKTKETAGIQSPHLNHQKTLHYLPTASKDLRTNHLKQQKKLLNQTYY